MLHPPHVEDGGPRQKSGGTEWDSGHGLKCGSSERNVGAWGGGHSQREIAEMARTDFFLLEFPNATIPETMLGTILS